MNGEQAARLFRDGADGVFQGGGVKGIALVGALREFEEWECTRWVSCAGTSAGAIIASYLAVGHTAEEAEQLLRETPYASFEDWGAGGKVLGGAWNALVHRGLARGEVFRRWMNDVLGGATFAAVKRDDGSYRLRLIAADVTNREMLVLPDDLPKYRQPGGDAPLDPDSFPIADAVRMSMSIPFFFWPIQLVPVAPSENGKATAATIVDGGVLSNFPVWLFDVQERPPARPTFGFHLTGGRGVGAGLQRIVRRLGWAVTLGTDIFHTATDAWDRRFLSHSTRVRSFPIPAGSIGTTDFELPPSAQEWLVQSGRQAARTFLEQFDPASYENTFGLRLAGAAADQG